MYQFKLNRIKLKNGKDYEPNKINIIIGPNNSGKSRFLKEMAAILSGEKTDKYIIKDLEYKLPKNYDELNQTYKIENRLTPRDINGNRHLKIYNNYTMNAYYPQYMGKENINSWIINNNIDFLLDYSALFFSYLGTENRLTMIKQIEVIHTGDQINFMLDLNNKLKIVGPVILDLSKYTKSLFKKDIWLDSVSEFGVINFRVEKDLEVYKNATCNDFEKRESLKFMNILDNEGDGLKSFISTYLSLKCEDRNILLIDEPEAFLHPPLARQLGEIIGESVSEDKQIFVTTHSSEMLKGILSKSDDVNIIRITREEDNNIITELEKENLENIMKTPRLRVSKILEGLFCEKVIITEAEADEIFYQEFLEKIQPYSGLYFTHVNSKENIVETSKMYSNLNVENAMVFDFDFIRNESDAFNKKLIDLGFDKKKIKEYIKISKDVDELIEIQAKNSVDINEDDSEYVKKLNAEKGKIYHREGINSLDEDLKDKVNGMLEELEQINVFVLRSGELETVLDCVGIKYTGNKRHWIEQAIEFIDKLNEDRIEKYKEIEIVKFIMKLKK